MIPFWKEVKKNLTENYLVHQHSNLYTWWVYQCPSKRICLLLLDLCLMSKNVHDPYLWRWKNRLKKSEPFIWKSRSNCIFYKIFSKSEQGDYTYSKIFCNIRQSAQCTFFSDYTLLTICLNMVLKISLLFGRINAGL